MLYEKQKRFIKNKMPEVLRNSKGTFIAGGAITSIFTNSEINDWDVYFSSEKAIADFVFDVLDDGYHLILMSPKAFTFVKDDITIQIIHYKTFQSAWNIFEAFDFNINMGAYLPEHDTFILDEKFLTGLATRQLEFNHKTDYPIISLQRVNKYKERGYTINNIDMTKIGIKIASLSLNSWEEFDEQLSGFYGQALTDNIDRSKPFSLEYVMENFNENFVYETDYTTEDYGYGDTFYRNLLKNISSYVIFNAFAEYGGEMDIKDLYDSLSEPIDENMNNVGISTNQNSDLFI